MTDGGFQIRRATVVDAPRLARFLADSFAQTFAAQNTAEDLAAYLGEAFGDEQQRRELADDSTQYWIAEPPNRGAAGVSDGPSLLGCAQIRLDSCSPAVSGNEQAELGRLYADSRWHGRGLGRGLLNHCVDAAIAAGATMLWLGVWEKNARAIAFYEKNGFRAVGEQAFQLGSDVQRDVVMVRRLT